MLAFYQIILQCRYTHWLHNWLIPHNVSPHGASFAIVSERIIDSLKTQVMYATTQEQAKEAIEILIAFGYRSKPILSDLMRECEDEKVRQYCKEALRQWGWAQE